MATTRLRQTKDGCWYYMIRVSRGRNLPPIERRWYVPEGWSDKAIRRQLMKEVAALERKVHDGEIVTRREQREKEEAEAAARAAAEAKVYTVRRFVEEIWLPEKAQTCAASTLEMRRHNLDHWILPAIGDAKIDEVTPPMITAILLDAQKKGKKVGTMQNLYALCCNIFNSAELHDAVETNPMRKVRKPQEKKDDMQTKNEKSLTVEELRTIIDALEHYPLLWRCVIHVLIDTGIRRGECAGLQWQDIDRETGAVAIVRQLVNTKKLGNYVANTKSGQHRTVFVSPATLKILSELRAEQEMLCEPEEPVWCFMWQPAEGKPIAPESITSRVKDLGDECGIPLHPHLFRHTWASLAILNGADVVSVSEALGHSTPSMTLNRYSHASSESTRRAALDYWNAIKKK